MSVAREQPQLGRRAAACEPPTVRAGHYPVFAAVQEQDRPHDLLRVESPWSDGGEVIIDQPLRPARNRGTYDVDQPGPRARECRLVRVSEPQVPRGGRS